MSKETRTVFSDAEIEKLERVRAELGLNTIEQAAEHLVKLALRRVARTNTGRGLSLVKNGRKGGGR